MISFMIFLFCLISVAIDFYFYRVLRAKKAPPVWRFLFVVLSGIIHLAVLLLSIYYKRLIPDPAFMSSITWVIFVFMMSFLSRFVFVFFLLLRWAMRSIFRRRYSFRFLPYVGAIVALSIVGVMSYGALWGRSELRVERVQIVSKDLPAAFDGFKVAQFSDVHLGNWGSDTSVISAMVDRINELNPDIVVQSGDLVNITPDELTTQLMSILGRIKAPVYSVLGNHDLGFYVSDTITHKPNLMVDDLMERQRRMGWTMLHNENRWIYRAQDSIMIGGVTYPNNISHNGYNSKTGGSDLKKALQGLKSDDFSILISHSPKLFDSVPEIATPNLVLAGHVHAMQAKIEIGGWKYSPASLLYPLYSGLYEDRGHYLYINDGIGYVLYPMRIGAKPEITLFTLRSK